MVKSGNAELAANNEASVDELRQRLDRELEMLATTAMQLYGGWWKVYVDNEAGLIAVRRDYNPTSFSS